MLRTQGTSVLHVHLRHSSARLLNSLNILSINSSSLKKYRKIASDVYSICAVGRHVHHTAVTPSASKTAMEAPKLMVIWIYFPFQYVSFHVTNPSSEKNQTDHFLLNSPLLREIGVTMGVWRCLVIHQGSGMFQPFGRKDT